MIKNVLRLALTLAIVGAVAAAGLGLTYSITKDRIAEQDRLKESEACVSALPGAESSGELEEQKELGKKAHKEWPDVKKVFTCKGVGAVMLVEAKGYGGPISIAVGIDGGGKVVGIEVIGQNETPGLGGNVVKEDFLGQFKGKTADDPLTVGEDIKAITGATVTSKAATGEIKEALEAFDKVVRGNT